MIRRSWVIYERKTRQVISNVYHRRSLVLNDLQRLNDYCGKRKYAMQLRKRNSETGERLSRYPGIELKELSKEEVDDG